MGKSQGLVDGDCNHIPIRNPKCADANRRNRRCCFCIFWLNFSVNLGVVGCITPAVLGIRTSSKTVQPDDGDINRGMRRVPIS